MTWTHSIELSEYPDLNATGRVLSTPSSFLIANEESGHSFCVVDRKAQHVTYFWRPHSPSLEYLFDMSEHYGFQTDAPSWSRLCKHIFKEHVTEKKSGYRPHPTYIALQRQGFHWHSTTVKKGPFPNSTELDIKSAYATKILDNSSLYLRAPGLYGEDFGAMWRFAELINTLDKKLRLALVGWLSAYRATIYEQDKSNPLHLKKSSFISCYDGGIFNLIHASLLKLWEDMNEFKELAGDDCIRSHTDSLLVSEDIPTKRLTSLLKLIQIRGYKVAVKGHGAGIMFDLNLGILGGRIIGPIQAAIPRFDEYINLVGSAAFPLCELDKRLAHLPYKNERFSVKQARELLRYTKDDLEQLSRAQPW